MRMGHAKVIELFSGRVGIPPSSSVFPSGVPYLPPITETGMKMFQNNATHHMATWL